MNKRRLRVLTGEYRPAIEHKRSSFVFKDNSLAIAYIGEYEEKRILLCPICYTRVKWHIEYRLTSNTICKNKHITLYPDLLVGENVK